VRDAKVRLLSLSDLDKRTNSYKRATTLIEQIEADCGGHDRLSTGERQIIQRAAVLGALGEHLEARWMAGEPFDPVTYCTIVNAQKRLLEAVGLRRVPKEIDSDDREAIAVYEAELAAP
jgi:hypothetical protein